MVNLAALKRAGWVVWWPPVYYELVYLVTALVASDTACLATSPGTSINTSANHQTELNIEVKWSQDNLEPILFRNVQKHSQISRHLKKNAMLLLEQSGSKDSHGRPPCKPPWQCWSSQSLGKRTLAKMIPWICGGWSLSSENMKTSRDQINLFHISKS